MTARAPVVLGADGLPQQLQAGDILQGLGGRIFKTSDQSITSNTTVAADSQLVATLGIGTWRVRILCFYDTSAGAGPGFKWDMNFAGTGTWGPFLYRYVPFGTSAGTSAETQFAGRGTPAAVAITSISVNNGGYVEFEGIITVTVSGAVQFRWAQSASSVNATVVKAGSYLEYSQVA